MLTCGFFCYDKLRLKATLSLSRSRDWGGSRNSIRCGQVLIGPLAAAQTAILSAMARNSRVEKIRVMLGIYYSKFLGTVFDAAPLEHLNRARPRNRLLSSVRSCGR